MKTRPRYAIAIAALVGSTALSALSGAAAAAQAAAQAASPSAPLTFDPAVKVGTLPNGLKYYIRQNAKPEKRAELRLVVNAGSVLEDPDQLGYAHFVEHMAFNGTTNFKKNELVSYLQSIGLRFGADLNAYTSFDETVYNLQVPTDTARIVERAFQVLADWAHGQLFDSVEVVNERGIVLEEWRSGKGAGERLRDQIIPVALRGSMYAERLPIGTEASITSANPAPLRRFYRDWYRADLMAVVAVGDFDPAVIEAHITRLFSPIPRPASPRPRVSPPVPPNTAPLIAIASDPEMPATSVQVGFKRRSEPTRTVGDYRRNLVERLYLGMLNTRLSDIVRKPNAPFLGASMSLGGFFGREVDAFTLSASVADTGIERGLEAMLTEVRRADEFGFLDAELQRAKTNVLRGYQTSFAERANTPHGALVGSYVNAYLYGTVPLGIEATWPLVQQLIPSITLAEVNGLATRWITPDNRVIIAQAPRKADLRLPTEAQLLSVFDRAAAATVTAYTETATEAPLLPTLPTPGRVVGERTIADVGVTEWRLSNGARVLVKPTDFRADQILFSGTSDGGISLASDDEHILASLATSIVSMGGAGTFDATELRRKLTGKVAGASASVALMTEGVSGSASPTDLETMFQLLYLRLTAPRLDTAAFLAFKQQVTPVLRNQRMVPQSALADTINAVLYRNHPRTQQLNEERLGALDPARALAFYNDRFSDFSDYTFTFVGTIDLATLKPMVEQYLASLPSTNRRETWRDVSPTLPSGVIERTVRKGSEQKALTQILFHGTYDGTQESRFAMGALVNVMRIRLVESLREHLGGTYSPNIGGGGSTIPRAEYSLTLSYESSPTNVERLAESAFALIDSIQTHGPTQADIDKVREQYTRSRETALKQNAFWAGSLHSREYTIDELSRELREYDDRVKNLTREQVQAAAKLYFNKQNYAKFVLLPEIMQ